MKIFGKELKFNNNKVYHSGDKPTPNEIGAATGKTVSATTAATAQWYRIATSPAGISRCMGNFTIEATVSGKHSATNLIAGVNYGINPTIQQISHSDYSAAGITKARIVYHTSYNNNYAYLEVYQPTATATAINVSAVNLVGWTLVTPSTVGSIPSGYTSKEITLVNNKIVANIQGSVSGSAGSATKATQDSAGQQINTTYIKGLSVSGKTITYTKGDGTTGTITTQDTNTTYSTGTASALGLTKLYTGTGTATDGTMTQSAINTALNGKAASSHTHNYAGSSSAGGAANSANTLATARTINGTSFNGSANITTANWGTARNITIGKTAKSVNGSGNVSWSLSEIGAFSSGGGDVGGNIHLTSDNAGITGVCGGGTDRWSIIGGGADDNGYLEINTKDNGNEPIYIRQYNTNGLVRTASILDGQGNSGFPGMVRAPRFAISGSLGGDNNSIYQGSGDAADWSKHNLVIRSHWGIGFRDYQDICRIVFDTRNGNINTRGLIYSEGGISCTAWGHFNGSISADGGATIGANAYLNTVHVSDSLVGEIKFAGQYGYSDPWNGMGCAIKAAGHIASTGIIKANQIRANENIEVGGIPLSIQSSAPTCGGVWIQF